MYNIRFGVMNKGESPRRLLPASQHMSAVSILNQVDPPGSTTLTLLMLALHCLDTELIPLFIQCPTTLVFMK